MTVQASPNTTLVGVSGKVIDETKMTLRIRTVRGEKTLLKEQVTILCDGVVIDGRLLTLRPEDRIKKKVKKWQRKKPQNQ